MVKNIAIQSRITLADASAIALPRQIEILSTPAALRNIEQDWRQLELENSGKTTVFQSFDWAMTWCDAYVNSGDKTEIFVLVGKSNSKTVFILPLAKNQKHGLNVLDWLTDPIGQYGDILCSKSHDPQIWLKAAFEHIAKLNNIDLVRLRHVRANGNVEQFAKLNLHNAKYFERAPFLDLTAFNTDAEYDARYTSTQRKRRKKIRKTLEELGTVNFRTVKQGAETDLVIEQSIFEKNAWLSDRGRFNRIMGCPRHINFLKQLAQLNSPTFKLLATELSAGDKPVSWEIAFRYNDTHFAYITSHMNNLTDLSPGRLHMDLSQRLALSDKQKTFDLMVPYDLHKDSWSSGTIPTNDYFMPISFLGKIYGAVYLRTLRPFIRQIYYKMPIKALKILQLITRH